ncbi:MAG: MurR/RpiR family transcriptional regulator [Anaerolineae bacterium]|jgi:DNA-binding MurR/RpiR family transcriptional regulator|nr:MurR/RpiR family transcriptional regulator [Anaerolineae bacterium]
MTDHDINSIGPQIRMQLPGLSDKERVIVNYLLDTGPPVSHLTIASVARVHEVSEAMIVKLAKKLGYNGFRDLRDRIARYSQLPVTDLYQEIDRDDSPEIIVRKIFRTAIQALEETIAILDMAHFLQAVTLLSHARQRDFYGVGGSATIIKDASHKFLRIGIRTTVYDDAHLMMMSAALLTAEDVVLAVSHSGQTSAVLEAARLARRNGAKVIALTNYPNSALAESAEVVLLSTARGSPLMSENAAARIAQLNIIDALFVSIAQQNIALAEANLEKTMSSVRQKRENR